MTKKTKAVPAIVVENDDNTVHEAAYSKKWSAFFKRLMVQPDRESNAVYTPDQAKAYILREIKHAIRCGGAKNGVVGPFCLIGTSGIGKTQLVDQLEREVSELLGEKITACKITAPNIHPDDIIGIPVVSTGESKSTWSIKSDERQPFSETGKEVAFISPLTDRMARAELLFIDELNRVPTAHHLNSMMNIILNQEILGQKLTKTFIVIVAVNPDWADPVLDLSQIEQNMAVRELDWAHRQRMLHRLRIRADVKPSVMLREIGADPNDHDGLAGHIVKTFVDWWNNDLTAIEARNANGEHATLNRMLSPRMLSSICKSIFLEVTGKDDISDSDLSENIARKMRNVGVPIHPDDINDENWRSAINRLAKRLEGEADVDLDSLLQDLDNIGFGTRENGKRRAEPIKVIDALEYLLNNKNTLSDKLYIYGLIIAHLMSPKPWETLEDSQVIQISERTQVVKGLILSKLFRNINFMGFIVRNLGEITAQAKGSQTDPVAATARFWLNMIDQLKNKMKMEQRLGDADVYYSAIESVIWAMCGKFSIIRDTRKTITNDICSQVPTERWGDLIDFCADELLVMPQTNSLSPMYQKSTVELWRLIAKVNLGVSHDLSVINVDKLHEAHKKCPVSLGGSFPGESTDYTSTLLVQRTFDALAVTTDVSTGYRPYVEFIKTKDGED